MTVSGRLNQPGTDAAIGDLASRTKSLEQASHGHLIYAGTYPTDPNTSSESPPFQNGWGNIGGNYPPLAFCINADGFVRIEGTCDGGLDGTVVVTLPEGYRPDKSQRFPSAVSSGSDIATWQIDPTGDLTLVARGYNPGVGGMSEGFIAAGPDGTVLTSEGGIAQWMPRAQWHVAAGVPSPALGVDGDMYLNSANGDYYQKAAGAWTLQGNLSGPAGPTGAAGSRWFTGAGAPSAGTGVDGDMYLNTTTGDVYQKAAGSWGAILENITGPAGPTGPSGASTLKVNQALGYSYEVYPVSLTAGTLTLNAREMFVEVIPQEIPAGFVSTGVVCDVASAPSGAAPTHVFLGLCDSSLTIVALTADLAATFGATAPDKPRYPFAGGAYTIPGGTDGVYYLVLFLTGGWGTTSPLVGQCAVEGSASRAVSGFPRPRYFATAPPTTLTVGTSFAGQTWIAQSGNIIWLALY